MLKLNELSVFLPAYNEGQNIVTVAQKILSVLPNVADVYELIIVNDGSTDDTGEVIHEFSLQNPIVKVVEHKQNRGYGAALRSGFEVSHYAWVVFTDADGQFDFSEIRLFIEKQAKENSDLVIGYYLKRAVAFYRKLNTFFWQQCILCLFGLKVRDIDCGFKLIRKTALEKISPLESERGAFISTELLIKAKKLGFKIDEVGVHHYPRATGSGTGANLNVIVKSFLDLFKLWRKLR